jgi:hypothetical protein
MQIAFDVEKFAGRRSGDRDLTFVLSYLKRHGCVGPAQYPSIEKITCQTPSSALRYCRYFASSGISPENEEVFLKNPKIAVRYLKMVNRPEFADPKTQKRFRNKFKKNAEVAFEWAKAFNTRLSESEEEVFRRDMSSAKKYAMYVIKGKFPEKVHNMILLASYENLPSYQKHCLAEYLKYSEKN